MTRLALRVAALEHAGAVLIIRADRPDDDLVALGDFRRLPGEAVDELKARIKRQHHAGRWCCAHAMKAGSKFLRRKENGHRSGRH